MSASSETTKPADGAGVIADALTDLHNTIRLELDGLPSDEIASLAHGIADLAATVANEQARRRPLDERPKKTAETWCCYRCGAMNTTDVGEVVGKCSGCSSEEMLF